MHDHGQRQQRYKGIHPRHHSTEPPPELDEPEIARFLAASQEDLIREVYIADTGEELLTVEADAVLDASYDWADFERRIGLDDIDEAAIDEGWERLQRKYGMKSSKIDDKLKGASKRDAASRSEHSRFDATGKRFTDVGISVEYCDEEPPEAQQRPRSQAQNVAPPNSEDQNDPAEKVGPLQHAAMQKQSSRLDRIETRLFNGAEAFQQPVNRKRPGYERRVMSMEREMERIAEDVLCNDDSHWYAGANIERVLLSPNMKNLTVYYSLDDGSTRPASWWRKMNGKLAKTVRAAFAQRLETKYVPRVFFEEVTNEQAVDGAIGEKSQLDMLFDQIAAERSENDRADKEVDAK